MTFAGPASLLLMSGVFEAVTRKIMGHRSAALERYQHLTPGFREATVQHPAGILQGVKLGRKSGTHQSATLGRCQEMGKRTETKEDKW